MDLLLQLGIALAAGLAGGSLLHGRGVPRVVGQILVGLGLGALGVLPRSTLESLGAINQIALGFIGFMVGGELSAGVFRKYGPKFLVILLCEGLMAAIVVGLAVTALTREPALGLLLGALAAPTAPAATVNVLWEYRSKGPLTTTILAIVALDDGLGLLLYAFAVAIAQSLLVTPSVPGWELWLTPLRDILGSLALGGGAGLIVERVMRKAGRDSEFLLVLLTGAILLNCGAAIEFGLSSILANLTMGVVLVNTLPMRKAQAFDLVKAFTPPIYLLFFVFIGARLDVSLLPGLGAIGVVYVAGRTAGKMGGARLGGQLSKAPPTVTRYLGWALFSQAGVAVGLALDVSHRFSSLGENAREVGALVLNVVAATTVLVQILGPPAVKYAISKAGEIPPEAQRRG